MNGMALVSVNPQNSSIAPSLQTMFKSALESWLKGTREACDLTDKTIRISKMTLDVVCEVQYSPENQPTRQYTVIRDGQEYIRTERINTDGRKSTMTTTCKDGDVFISTEGELLEWIPEFVKGAQSWIVKIRGCFYDPHERALTQENWDFNSSKALSSQSADDQKLLKAPGSGACTSEKKDQDKI